MLSVAGVLFAVSVLELDVAGVVSDVVIAAAAAGAAAAATAAAVLVVDVEIDPAY